MINRRCFHEHEKKSPFGTHTHGTDNIALLDSSKSIYPEQQLFIYVNALQNCKCAPWETGSYDAYHINKLV